MAQQQVRPSRRAFLGGVGVTAAGIGLMAGLPPAIAEASAAARGTGTLDDVEHVVILMQENRSFDHYYGTMRGVRGFSDPTKLTLPTGLDVLHQPDAARPDGGFLLPFHVDSRKVDGQDLADLAHDWDTTHLAWDAGRYDQWVTAKTEMTMSYFTDSDIPFHRALANAFTICDSYHCSIQGPTTPNRLYHWTGMIDPAGTAGGPATANPPDYQPVYSWTTYPERLQRAGISWQVYANDEVGDGSDGYVGDYGDNPLWLFQAYHDALASTDPAVRQLADRASLRTTWKPDSGQGKNVNHVIAQFARDCATGKLPAVSWVVAPYLYSEHPAARPVDGEAYVQGVLNALWANPSLWAKTIVLINYDENDGFYDHVPPPIPPAGTPGEFLPAVQPAYDGLPPAFGPPTPIGLGPRVPMTVISPWSHGGWVNSQVFDHTSVLRLLEAWTGVRETNISAWRRSICGDLTSCFDFATKTTKIPMLPDTAALRRAADRTESTLPAPAPPAPGAQRLPVQDPGRLRTRALPYQPLTNFTTVGPAPEITLTNQGSATCPMAIYQNHLLEFTSTPVDVAAGRTVSEAITPGVTTALYEVEVHGPNGHLARATGDALSAAARVDIELSLIGTRAHPLLRISAHSHGTSPQSVTFTPTTGRPVTRSVPSGTTVIATVDPFASTHGWYDFSVVLNGYAGYLRRYAGHVENGQPGLTR